PVAAAAAAVRGPHPDFADPPIAARRAGPGGGHGGSGRTRLPVPADAARGDQRRLARDPGAALLPLSRRTGRAVRAWRTGARLWHAAARPARAGDRAPELSRAGRGRRPGRI